MVETVAKRRNDLLRLIEDLLLGDLVSQCAQTVLNDLVLGRDVALLHRCTDLGLDALKFFELMRRYECDRDSLVARTSCTADTVNIRL